MKETRHLGVYGIVIHDNKILLVKKSRGAYTGKYDLPGGSIEHGEKPVETLKRELLEEVGVNIKSFKLYDANSVIVNWFHHEEMENMHHIGIIYIVDIENDTIKETSDGQDSLGAKWISIEELNKDMISPLVYEELIKLGYFHNSLFLIDTNNNKIKNNKNEFINILKCNRKSLGDELYFKIFNLVNAELDLKTINV